MINFYILSPARISFFKHIGIIFFCLFFPTLIFAQTIVKGEVLDETTSTPLVGARVVIKGKPIGGLTNTDGEFEFRSPDAPPFELMITYLGYDTLNFVVTSLEKSLKVSLTEKAVSLDEVVITAAIDEKKKQSALTMESMSINAIKETPAANFYDGLGALKEVDLTSASIGFKIINTRGFNSTLPVRSLQIIDGVDNQSPGLNFSLGNFLGASELDVEQVDLIIGASSAFYGPNAFNGVISMRTKDPFIHRGLSAMVKVGERNLREVALRYAKVFKIKGEEKLAFKFNLAYLDVNDWEADNLDPVDDAKVGRDNPGSYDAVNRYGDENLNGGINNATSTNQLVTFPGLGRWHRTGYEEVDIVDYDTENLKLGAAIHYKLKPEVDFILASNFAQGTTVLQGDNRYSLKDILFFQHRVEVRKKDKFFVRAYATHEDAGNSYDAVFTAFRLQEGIKNDIQWSTDYQNFWAGLSPLNPYYAGLGGMRARVMKLEGFPPQTFPYDFEKANQVLAANSDSLFAWHALARDYADNVNFSYLQPGSPEFEKEFQKITSTPIAQGGTRLVDRSALFHLHGEYKFNPSWTDEITLGANGRLYRPVSDGNLFVDSILYDIKENPQPDGTILLDTISTTRKKISNYEYGVYAGIEKRVANETLRLNATVRIDKNQNFRFVPSYAASMVYTPSPRDVIRLSLSAAIRNPTLADQYLGYNVGRAVLRGNIDGFNHLADTSSLRRYFEEPVKDSSLVDYFNIAPVQPEKVQTVEVGYRTSLFNDRFFLDASYYFSRYEDFLGFNIGVDVRFSPTFPDRLISAQAYRVAANSRDVVTTQGFSAGVNYFFKGGYTFNGNYSWNVLNTQSDDPIVPAYNTPEHKFNIGFSGRDIKVFKIKHAGFSVNYKWVEGFLFEGSPQFTGRIPTYSLLDVQINKFIPKIKSTFKLGASNVLDKKQFQVYGGPRVGRLIYFSILTDLKNL